MPDILHPETGEQIFEIYADDRLLYASGYQVPETMLISPRVKLEIGRAGSMTFGILPRHYLYKNIQKLRTNIRCYHNGEEIFNGRILNWDTDMSNRRSVTCEGNLAYFNDTLQPPRNIECSGEALFRMYVAEHNMQVAEDKQFKIGQINVEGMGKVVLWEDGTYRTTRDAIDSDLINRYGGVLRTRNENGELFIDYLSSYGETGTQDLVYAKNILDVSENIAVDDVYTVLLPTGAAAENDPNRWPVTIESVNGGSKLIENVDGIALYGRIVRTESFPDCKTPEDLKREAESFFKKAKRNPEVIYPVKALDLHYLDTSIEQFRIGRMYKLKSAPNNIDETLTCLKMDYDLENIENTQLELGMLRFEQGKVRSSTGVSSHTPISRSVGRSSGGGGGGGLGMALKYITEGQDSVRIATKKIEAIGEEIASQAGEIKSHGTLIAQNKDAITLEANRAKTEEGKLSSKLTIEAGKIEAEVQRATASEETLSSRITQTAQEITLSVKKGEIINSINLSSEGVRIKASKLDVSGIIHAGGIVVNGDLEAINAKFNNLISGYTVATVLKTGSMYTSHFFMNGRQIEKTLRQPLKSAELNVTKGKIVDQSGVPRTVVTDVSLSTTKYSDTILKER